jgi:hypothetical protein
VADGARFNCAAKAKLTSHLDASDIWSNKPRFAGENVCGVPAGACILDVFKIVGPFGVRPRLFDSGGYRATNIWRRR